VQLTKLLKFCTELLDLDWNSMPLIQEDGGQKLEGQPGSALESNSSDIWDHHWWCQMCSRLQVAHCSSGYCRVL